MKLWRKSQN